MISAPEPAQINGNALNNNGTFNAGSGASFGEEMKKLFAVVLIFLMTILYGVFLGVFFSAAVGFLSGDDFLNSLGLPGAQVAPCVTTKNAQGIWEICIH